MVKSIIKEIVIIILLIVASVLALGVMFYEYNPTTKKIPSEVKSYTLSQDMHEELDKTIETAEKQNIIKTYRVDAEDLQGYERSKDYKKGKTNPFAQEAVVNNTKKTTNTSNGGGTSTSTSSSQDNEETDTSEGSDNTNTTSNETNETEPIGGTSQGRFLNEVK